VSIHSVDFRATSLCHFFFTNNWNDWRFYDGVPRVSEIKQELKLQQLHYIFNKTIKVPGSVLPGSVGIWILVQPLSASSGIKE